MHDVADSILDTIPHICRLYHTPERALTMSKLFAASMSDTLHEVLCIAQQRRHPCMHQMAVQQYWWQCGSRRGKGSAGDYITRCWWRGQHPTCTLGAAYGYLEGAH